MGGKGNKYRTYHVNCMRKWNFPSAAVFLVEEEEEENLGKTEKDPTQNMPASQNMDLIKFKEIYRDVLLEVPGRTTLVCHEIPTGSALPIRLPPYRLAHHSKEVLREEIKTLLDQDIIKSSKSPWAVPIVSVKKKDGTQRMCVDYRRLNKVTINDPYPLPNIDDLISNLGASKYITMLNLIKGYARPNKRVLPSSCPHQRSGEDCLHNASWNI